MIGGVLLDLGGVVYVGDAPLAGALEALERLRATGLPLRYITNTTRTPKRAMLAKLHRLGVLIGFWQNAPAKLTPSVAAIRSRFGVTAPALPMCPSTSPRH